MWTNEASLQKVQNTFIAKGTNIITNSNALESEKEILNVE